MNQENKILTVSVDQGQSIKIAGGQYRIIVSGRQTNGSFATIEMSVPPGAGPVPHSHPDFNETFYVLEGEVDFKSEKGSYTAQKDTFVSIPPGGIIHCFKNSSSEPAKLLCTVMPAGLDEFFIEASEIMEAMKDKPGNNGLDVKEHMDRLSEKYGQKLYPPDYFDQKW